MQYVQSTDKETETDKQDTRKADCDMETRTEEKAAAGCVSARQKGSDVRKLETRAAERRATNSSRYS